MIRIHPVTLEGHGVRLEPLAYEHHDGLAVAAADGRLWELWFTAVPEPGQTRAYIADALAGQAEGHMLPWAVRELTGGTIIGSTRYHDIVAAIDRVEIGSTWYAQALATQPRQHRLQAVAARPCVRRPWVQGGRSAHRPVQLRLTASDRGLRRQEGWRHPPSPSSPRRNGTRHRDL